MIHDISVYIIVSRNGKENEGRIREWMIVRARVIQAYVFVRDISLPFYFISIIIMVLLQLKRTVSNNQGW